jgi:hypothetical protein
LPEFRLLVDGRQVGGIHTVTANHDLAQWQTVNFALDASTPLNGIRVEFLNDAYGGSADKDRNLYVDSIEVNGTKHLSQDAIYDRIGTSDLPGQANMPWAGALVFDAAGHNGHVAAPSAPQTTIAVHVSGDEYQGLPEFRLLVDGRQVGGIHTVTANHDLAQWQTVNFALDASTPLNDIRVEFLNDAYGGSADKDRNLYVDSIEVNGAKHLSQDAIYDRVGTSDLPGQTVMSWAGALVFDAAGNTGGPSATLAFAADTSKDGHGSVDHTSGSIDLRTLGLTEDHTVRAMVDQITAQHFDNLTEGTERLSANYGLDADTLHKIERATGIDLIGHNSGSNYTQLNTFMPDDHYSGTEGGIVVQQPTAPLITGSHPLEKIASGPASVDLHQVHPHDLINLLV